MSSYETCRECDSETGRAGASEDSLYHSYVGPFCEDCYDDWPDKIEAELAKVRREFRDFRAGQAVSVPEWIKCSERLPESGITVLVSNNSGAIYTCRRSVIERKNLEPDGADFTRERFTHWMPLPDPPKQEQDDE
jgi:hypothetical protein